MTEFENERLFLAWLKTERNQPGWLVHETYHIHNEIQNLFRFHTVIAGNFNSAKSQKGGQPKSMKS